MYDKNKIRLSIRITFHEIEYLIPGDLLLLCGIKTEMVILFVPLTFLLEINIYITLINMRL